MYISVVFLCTQQQDLHSTYVMERFGIARNGTVDDAEDGACGNGKND